MSLRRRGRRSRAGELALRARPRGRRGQAARRQHAHPLGSAHAGEGAGDGAMAARSTVLLAQLRSVARGAEKEKGRGGRGARLGPLAVFLTGADGHRGRRRCRRSARESGRGAE